MGELLANLFVWCVILWLAFIFIVPIIKIVFTVIVAVLSVALPLLLIIGAIGLVIALFK
jgi:hypothetical protein